MMLIVVIVETERRLSSKIEVRDLSFLSCLKSMLHRCQKFRHAKTNKFDQLNAQFFVFYRMVGAKLC